MSNLLRKIFFPTEEEIKAQIKYIEELERLTPDIVELKKVENNEILLVSTPFQRFKKDCTYCNFYTDSIYDFVEGGDCDKHHIPCGWGFTCKDWSNK